MEGSGDNSLGNDTLLPGKDTTTDASDILQAFWLLLLILLICWACLASVIACGELAKVKVMASGELGKVKEKLVTWTKCWKRVHRSDL